jgi:hypothetical protein
MPHADPEIQTLLDIQAIKTLKYRYCRDNDGGWPEQPKSHQGPSADLFTEDGVWDGRPLGPIAVGREAVRQLFKDFAGLPMAYHAVMNPMIEVEGDFATGHWHLIAGGVGLDGGSTLTIGGYEDEYVRTAQGWRIKSMRVIAGRITVLPEGWGGDWPELVAAARAGAA